MELDQSTALRLAQTGAALLVLNMPERSLVAVDQKVASPLPASFARTASGFFSVTPLDKGLLLLLRN